MIYKNIIRKFLVIPIVIMLTVTGCGNSGLYVDTEDGYRNINTIEGITFDVPESLINNSTAITMINNESEFELSQTYLYKDGEEQYLIFNMNSVVIAAQKGTTFDMTLDNESLIESGSILGIWFEKDGRKLNMDGTQEKIIADVKGDVSITTEMYGEFYGSLAIVDNESEQWAVFVGLTNDNLLKDEDEKKETIEHIVKSLQMTGTINEKVESEEVDNSLSEEDINIEEKATQSLQQENQTSEAEGHEITSEYSEDITMENTDYENVADIEVEETVEDSSSQIEQTEECEAEPTNIIDKEIEQSEVEEKLQEVENIEDITTQTGVQIIEKEDSDNETVLEETSEEPSSISIDNENINEVSDSHVMNLNNQSTVDQNSRNSNEPCLSDIYSLLQIGTTTLFSSNITIDNQTVTGQINVTDITMGAEAKQLLARHGVYDSAPTGCEWHVATYKTNINPDTAYINIKLRGLDGEVLRYRGISYSKKTYDILYEVAYNGEMYQNLYCYYAVPKGCKQYVLECGDGTVNTGYELYAGYYLINCK